MHRRRFLHRAAVTSLALGLRRACAAPVGSALRVDHLPRVYGRRVDELTANVCGRYDQSVGLEYRVNEGVWTSWRPPEAGSPRTPAGRFTIEVPAADLHVGPNRFAVRSGSREIERDFTYVAKPVSLPATSDWTDPAQLDVQDGQWEIAHDGRGNVVRPVPGTEDYDRLLLATGMFAGARRVECEMTFKTAPLAGRPFGFGLIPLWAGHRENEAVRPRRGWRFGIAWYYSNWSGFGVEGSDKLGAAKPRSLDVRSPTDLRRGSRWHLVSEAKPTGAGWKLGLAYSQIGANAASHTVEVEIPGDLLPGDREYSVALVAHRAQVEFGPVRVRAL